MSLETRGEKFAVTRQEWRDATLVTVLAAIPRFAAIGIGSLNMHAARDIFRALHLLSMHDVPLAGSELYFGGAVPGNFYFFLAAVPLIFWKSPYAVMAWIALLTSLAAGITHLSLRMVMGRMAAIVSCVVYALFPLAIAEGLWMWNPSYLPFIASVALWGLCYWVRYRRGAGLAVMLTGGVLGIQVHLSAYALVVSGVLTFLAMTVWKSTQRFAAGTRGAGVLHFLVPLAIALPFAFPFLWMHGKFLFIPLRLKMGGDAGIGIFDPQINPHAFSTLAQGFVFLDDTLLWQEFLNFQRFLVKLTERLPGLGDFCSRIAPVVSAIGGGIFAVAGFIALGVSAISRGKFRERILLASSLNAECARPFSFALLAWLIVPAVILMKTLGNDPAHPLGIPTRYVVIFFPAAMVLVGVGFSTLMELAAKWRAARALFVAMFGAAQVTHAVILALFIWTCTESAGVFKGTLPLNYTKPLFVEKALCDFMAVKHHATLEDFRERFLSDGNFMDMVGEQFLNFELWEGSGGSGADARIWFYLYDTSRNAMPPRLIRESGPIVDELRVKQFRILAIRREDVTKPVIWPKPMLESPMIH